jgi:hypothetical protein
MNADLIAYAGGVLKLCFEALLNDVALPLHDVEAVLCEDGKTVSLLAPDGRGHWISVSFELSEPVDEASFDSTPYTEAFADRRD